MSSSIRIMVLVVTVDVAVTTLAMMARAAPSHRRAIDVILSGGGRGRCPIDGRHCCCCCCGCCQPLACPRCMGILVRSVAVVHLGVVALTACRVAVLCPCRFHRGRVGGR